MTHHERLAGIHTGTFGGDRFGQAAERFARLFGTAKFIACQTAIIIIWVALNVVFHLWDRYPFILLNLVFSTQAAYAAPLILLAQTRQAERDKQQADADAQHREETTSGLAELLAANTRLTEQIHAKVTGR